MGFISRQRTHCIPNNPSTHSVKPMFFFVANIFLHNINFCSIEFSSGQQMNPFTFGGFQVSYLHSRYMQLIE